MNILEFLQTIVSTSQAQTLAYLILANLILGSIAAAKSGRFELAKFTDFLKRIAFVFGGYLGAAFASKAMADFVVLRDIAWGALIAYMGTQITSNVTEILGVKIPDKVTRLLERQ